MRQASLFNLHTSRCYIKSYSYVFQSIEMRFKEPEVAKEWYGNQNYRLTCLQVRLFIQTSLTIVKQNRHVTRSFVT